MKRTTIMLILALGFIMQISAETITIKLTNVRSNKGSVLVMCQPANEGEPVYGMSKAQKGTTTVILENLIPGDYNISVMHDENENMQMDLDEDQRPQEAYAMKKLKANEEDQEISLKFFYPVTE